MIERNHTAKCISVAKGVENGRGGHEEVEKGDLDLEDVALPMKRNGRRRKN